ncbi:MAG: SAM-dependent methyltransferase [Candidatus Binataceae bacterium]
MATYNPHDKFFHKARARGLPSRAAFKLEEILRRFHLAPPNARVADLGCAPGGWLSILSDAVGSGGRVAGVDIAACAIHPANVRVITGDILDPRIHDRVKSELGGRADLITSDLAPKLSGVAERDQARLGELLEAALAFASAALRPGGAMVAKVFMGPGFGEFPQLFRQCFKKVEVTHTRASRPGSSELYIVARDFTGAAHEGAFKMEL